MGLEDELLDESPWFDPLEDEDSEEWRQVAGFRYYMVSSYGRVKNLRTGKIIGSTPTRPNQYSMVALSEGGVPRPIGVHRLVAEAFVPGQEPYRDVVHHIDNDKTNNRADNLMWVNQQENLHHSLRERGIWEEDQNEGKKAKREREKRENRFYGLSLAEIEARRVARGEGGRFD